MGTPANALMVAKVNTLLNILVRAFVNTLVHTLVKYVGAAQSTTFPETSLSIVAGRTCTRADQSLVACPSAAHAAIGQAPTSLFGVDHDEAKCRWTHNRK